MFILRQNFQVTVEFDLGATGLTPNATLSQDGGAFVASTNPVVEMAHNVYSLVITAGETSFSGGLVVHLDAGTPNNFFFQVGLFAAAQVVKWLADTPNALVGGNVPAVFSALGANAINAAAIDPDVIPKLFETIALAESYAADGAEATPAQLLYALLSALTEFAIAGTTLTCKQLDGSTTSMVFTLNNGTNPTSRTRSG